MYSLSAEDESTLKSIIDKKHKPLTNVMGINLDSVPTNKLKEEIILREIRESKKVSIEHYKNSSIYFELVENDRLNISIGGLNYTVDKGDIHKLKVLFSLLDC